jgi:catechol 2,3-dioxygenase-like lactoylglutathione lyase family enzyme
MNPPRINSQITFLYTVDLGRTANFYEDFIGLPLVLDQGTCRIYQVSDEGFLGFCERKELSPELPDLIITFVVDDVEKWYQYLKDQGIQCENPPSYNPKYDIYHCFFQDPNGYLIEIQKFRTPDWQSAT